LTRTFRLRPQPISDDGPLVTLDIGPGHLPSMGARANPSARVRRVRALLDTGASHTIIVDNVPFALSLEAVEAFEMHGQLREGFRVRLWWDGSHSTWVTAIASEEPRYLQLSAIIGRDVLSRGRLVFDGRNGCFEFDIDCD
jgi:hypothetical protein